MTDILDENLVIANPVLNDEDYDNSESEYKFVFIHATYLFFLFWFIEF